MDFIGSILGTDAEGNEASAPSRAPPSKVDADEIDRDLERLLEDSDESDDEDEFQRVFNRSTGATSNGSLPAASSFVSDAEQADAEPAVASAPAHEPAVPSVTVRSPPPREEPSVSEPRTEESIESLPKRQKPVRGLGAAMLVPTYGESDTRDTSRKGNETGTQGGYGQQHALRLVHDMESEMQVEILEQTRLNQELERKLQHLEALISLKDGEIESKEAEIETMQERLNDLVVKDFQHRREMTVKIEEMKKDLQDREQQLIAEQIAVLEQTKKDVSEKEKEIRSLQNELDRLKGDAAERENAMEDQSRRERADAEEFQVRMNILEEQSANFQQEKDALEDRVQDLSRSLEERESELDREKRRFDEEKNRLESSLRSAEDEKKSKERQIHELTYRVEELQQHLRPQSVAYEREQAKYAVVEEQLRLKEREMRREMSKAAKAEFENQRFAEKLQESEMQIRKLQQQLEQLERTMEDAAVAVKTGELKLLEKDRRIVALEDVVLTLSKDLHSDKLYEHLTEAQERADALSKRLRTLEATIEERDTKLEAAAAKFELAEEDSGKLRKEIEALKESHADEIEHRDAVIAKLRTALSAARDELRNVQVALKNSAEETEAQSLIPVIVRHVDAKEVLGATGKTDRPVFRMEVAHRVRLE